MIILNLNYSTLLIEREWVLAAIDLVQYKLDLPSVTYVPFVSHLISLGLSFLICKVGIITVILNFIVAVWIS